MQTDYVPLPNLGEALRNAFPEGRITLKTKTTNYLFAELNEIQHDIIVKILKEHIKEHTGSSCHISSVPATYHVTLLFPPAWNTTDTGLVPSPEVARAASFIDIPLPTITSKKECVKANLSVLRALQNRFETVEVTFGNMAFITKDGCLAGIEVHVSSNVFYEITPNKIFHITLAHNRDIKDRAPVYSNSYLENMRDLNRADN